MNAKQISPLLRKHSVAIAQHLATLSPEIQNQVLEPAVRSAEETKKETTDSIDEEVQVPSTEVYQQIYRTVEDCVREVDGHLHRGYLENTYREALALELRSRGLECQTEVAQTLSYKGKPLSYGQSRIDILVESRYVIELKADALSENTVSKARLQCLRYLVQGDYPFGMVVGFPDKPEKPIHVSFVEKKMKE
jgi:GxxExxY protein